MGLLQAPYSYTTCRAHWPSCRILKILLPRNLNDDVFLILPNRNPGNPPLNPKPQIPTETWILRLTTSKALSLSGDFAGADRGTVCITFNFNSLHTSRPDSRNPEGLLDNRGALIIRVGFGGPVYYNYTTEPPQNSIGNYLGPYMVLGPQTKG